MQFNLNFNNSLHQNQLQLTQQDSKQEQLLQEILKIAENHNIQNLDFWELLKELVLKLVLIDQ